MRVRYHVAVGIVGVALLAGSAAAVVTSDAFVRRMVAGVVARFVRGPAHFRSASFSFRDGLVVEGLEVRDPHDPLAPPAVEVVTLRADYGLFVLGGGPRVTSVVLDHPTVRLRHLPDGSLSVASLLPVIEKKAAGAALPPQIEVRGGTIVYDDPVLLAGAPATLTAVAAVADPTGDAWRVAFRALTPELGPMQGTLFAAPGGSVTASVDLDAVTVTPALLQRLKLPGALATQKLRARGKLRGHVEAAYTKGAPLVVSGKVEMSGFAATVTLPDPRHAASGPQPFDVHVTSGTATLRDGAVELSRLTLLALGATVRCEHARVAEIDAEGGPTVEADVAVEELPIDDALRAAVPEGVRAILDTYGLGGRLDGTAQVRGRLLAPSVVADAAISGGTVSYEGHLQDDGVRRGFPWKVTGASLAVSFRGGDTFVIEGDGRHGGATVRATGKLVSRAGDWIPDLWIHVDEAPLDGDLRAAFQDRAARIFDRWGASGVAKRIDVHVHRDPHVDGPWGASVDVTILADGRAAIRPLCLPTTIAAVTGTIRVLALPLGGRRIERVLLDDLHGSGDGFDVRISGRVDADQGASEEDLVLDVAVADFARSLRQAVVDSGEFVPSGVKRLVTDLGLAGALDVHGLIAGDGGRRSDRVTVSLRGATATGYRDVPFAVSNLAGAVTYEGDEARLEDLRGAALGTTVRATGRIFGLATGRVEPDLDVAGADVPLGEPLRRALGPLATKAAAFWEKLRPGGTGAPGEAGGAPEPETRADVKVGLRPSDSPAPLDLVLTHIRGPLHPLGLALTVGDGELHYDGREVTSHLSAEIGEADVRIDSARFDVRTGRLEVEMRAQDLRFPDDLRSLFGPAATDRMRAALPGRLLRAHGVRIVYDPREERTDVSGEIALRAAPDAGDVPGLAPDGLFRVERLSIWFPPDLHVAFDGVARAEGLRLHPGITVEDFAGPVTFSGRIDPDGVQYALRTKGARLTVQDLPVADAEIEVVPKPRGPVITLRTASLWGGTVSANVGPGGGRIAYSGAIRVRGADLARISSPTDPLAGTLDADVEFRNVTGEADSLSGTIAVDVRDGKLQSFPVVVTILNLTPGAGDLTQAHMNGRILGTVIKIHDLSMTGPTLSLSDGKGTVGLGDGALNVSLTPGGLLLTVLQKLTFSKVHVGGTVRHPEVSLRPFSSGLDDEPAAAPPEGGR